MIFWCFNMTSNPFQNWYGFESLVNNPTICSKWCKISFSSIAHSYPPTFPFADWTFFNTLRPKQNSRHVADDTFKRFFLSENVRISIKFSLKFVPKGAINTIPALVQIMAWRRPGDKPLSEPVMVSLLTHICVTRPQWVKVNILKQYILQMCFRFCELLSIWRLVAHPHFHTCIVYWYI